MRKAVSRITHSHADVPLFFTGLWKEKIQMVFVANVLLMLFWEESQQCWWCIIKRAWNSWTVYLKLHILLYLRFRIFGALCIEACTITISNHFEFHISITSIGKITIDEDISRAENRVPRQLRGLDSDLIAAEPKQRPKRRYDNCYRMPLSDVDDGDVNTINQDSSDESEFLMDPISDKASFEKCIEIDAGEIIMRKYRPSEEEIAKLSSDQKRQVSHPLSGRKIQGFNPISAPHHRKTTRPRGESHIIV